jgi:hypothetical protein
VFLEHLPVLEIKVFKEFKVQVEFKVVLVQKDRWDYPGLLVQLVGLQETPGQWDHRVFRALDHKGFKALEFRVSLDHRAPEHKVFKDQLD